MAKIILTEENIFDYIKLNKIEYVYNRIQKDTNDTKFVLNKQNPIIKDMFGAIIDDGFVVVSRISYPKAVSICNGFLSIEKTSKKIEVSAIQNYDLLEKFCIENKMERPNPEIVQGYIINNEMVQYQRIQDFDVIDFKYKDTPINVFFRYRIYFIVVKKELFLCLEKSY